MKLRKITDRILHVKFSTTYEMCKTLVRIGELYENPHFKGKAFTLDEFKIWYKEFTKRKNFRYFSDWDGFNLPGGNIALFKTLDFYPLTKNEQQFLDLLENIKEKELYRSYLVITAKNSEKSTYKHELSHSLFGTNEKYKKRATTLIEGFKEKNKVRKFILGTGYHKSVWIDEAQAYILEDYRHVEKKCAFPKHSLKQLSKDLNEQFNYFWKGNRRKNSRTRTRRRTN